MCRVGLQRRCWARTHVWEVPRGEIENTFLFYCCQLLIVFKEEELGKLEIKNGKLSFNLPHLYLHYPEPSNIFEWVYGFHHQLPVQRERAKIRNWVISARSVWLINLSICIVIDQRGCEEGRYAGSYGLWYSSLEERELVLFAKSRNPVQGKTL